MPSVTMETTSWDAQIDNATLGKSDSALSASSGKEPKLSWLSDKPILCNCSWVSGNHATKKETKERACRNQIAQMCCPK